MLLLVTAVTIFNIVATKATTVAIATAVVLAVTVVGTTVAATTDAGKAWVNSRNRYLQKFFWCLFDVKWS